MLIRDSAPLQYSLHVSSSLLFFFHILSFLLQVTFSVVVRYVEFWTNLCSFTLVCLWRKLFHLPPTTSSVPCIDVIFLASTRWHVLSTSIPFISLHIHPFIFSYPFVFFISIPSCKCTESSELMFTIKNDFISVKCDLMCIVSWLGSG